MRVKVKVLGSWYLILGWIQEATSKMGPCYGDQGIRHKLAFQIIQASVWKVLTVHLPPRAVWLPTTIPTERKQLRAWLHIIWQGGDGKRGFRTSHPPPMSQRLSHLDQQLAPLGQRAEAGGGSPLPLVLSLPSKELSNFWQPVSALCISVSTSKIQWLPSQHPWKAVENSMWSPASSVRGRRACNSHSGRSSSSAPPPSSDTVHFSIHCQIGARPPPLPLHSLAFKSSWPYMGGLSRHVDEKILPYLTSSSHFIASNLDGKTDPCTRSNYSRRGLKRSVWLCHKRRTAVCPTPAGGRAREGKRRNARKRGTADAALHRWDRR